MPIGCFAMTDAERSDEADKCGKDFFDRFAFMSNLRGIGVGKYVRYSGSFQNQKFY
jgi:hypothetical protein